MNNFEAFLYLVCVVAIGGAAFAMMWSNIQSINIEMSKPPTPKHPEAPQPGEELMSVRFREIEVSEEEYDGYQELKKRIDSLKEKEEDGS